MPDAHDDETTTMLQRGLRDLHVPPISMDFDARVRAGLRRPPPLWHQVLGAARLTLAPAGLSLAVTLAVLITTGAPRPDGPPKERPRTSGNIALEPRTDRLTNIEQNIEQLDGSTPSLGSFGRQHAPPSGERGRATATPGRRGASGRRGTYPRAAVA